ncbi:MAG: diguanylate cyclase [Solirubrobacteraceae bacterium]
MASPASDDHPVKRSNGSSNGQRERIGAAAEVLHEEQALADAEQTLAEADQTIVDADQTNADFDQTSADRDQSASDRDQVASDDDLAHGGDLLTHDSSRDSRQRSTRDREEGTAGRLDVASRRDAGAHQRDVGALARDQAADARDLAMVQRDAVSELADGRRVVTGAEIVLRAAERRKRAARDRVQAAEHRVLAAQDRRSARDDRERAERDRLQARGDRDALAAALVIAETDALTGVHTRVAGLRNLDLEVDRCRRSDGTLVVAYVDVVGLKAVNDSEGHAAGDDLLKHVVALIRAHLRTYDLIIRLGGDEFLCAMSRITPADARQRFSDVTVLLSASPDAGAIRAGFAELAPEDAVTDLIARADNELLDQRSAAKRQ